MSTPHDVVVVMTDQHRADLCAREGFAVDCAPTLDRLAAGGRWFDRAYTAAPVCMPARISMLTGRYPSAHGVRENRESGAARYTEDLFDLARTAGFRTAMIGKNHSHLTPARADEFREYGHFGRIPPGRETGQAAAFDDWLRRLGPRTATGPTPHPVTTQLPARIVDQAIRWLDDDPAEHSLLWLSIPEPHVPYQAPEPYFSRYSPASVPPPATDSTSRPDTSLPWRYVRDLADRVGESTPDVLARARANYVGMLRLIDDQIARLVDHLAAAGRLDRTLLVFVADHGDFAGEYGLMRKGPGLPEVLTRIPMFFTGPGVRPASEPAAAHVSIVDVLPTVCELLDWPVPEGVQGRSLAPILRGEPFPAPEFDSCYAEQGVGGLPYHSVEELPRRGGDRLDGGPAGGGPDDSGVGDGGAGESGPSDSGPSGDGPSYGGVGGADSLSEATQSGSMRMVRAGRWKLVADVSARYSLYDLDADPYELTDLYGHPEHAEPQRRMLELLAAWLIRTTDPLPIPAGGYHRNHHPRNYHWPTTTP